MKYTTGKKMYIYEKDNSPSRYCISGEYSQIDPNKINFQDWKEKSLKMDPEVDFTYWVFDINISKDLKNRYKDVDEFFTQNKYIITNRRIVHVFNNDPYYHASGFHKNPKNIVEVLKGIFMPDEITFSKGRGPVFYGLKNNDNKVKSFINIQDDKFLKIQTSYFSESISIIESLEYVFSDNIEMFSHVINESEQYLAPLQEKYLLIEKLLYTYNPNVIALGNSVMDYSGIKYLSLDEEQVLLVIDNAKFIEEDLGCNYLIENNDLILRLKN